MDHYKVMGLSRNATKDEIKEAFRRLAFKFHPDRHSQSSQSVKDSATLRFKQVSEAYEVLSDDRKRADFNIRSRTSGNSESSGSSRNRYRHYYQNSGSGHGKFYNSSYRPGSGSNGYGFISKLENLLLFLTTRAFLLNLGFAGALLGSAIAIDASKEAIWKKYNSGKSFEEAIDSIEKAKTRRDRTNESNH